VKDSLCGRTILDY